MNNNKVIGKKVVLCAVAAAAAFVAGSVWADDAGPNGAHTPSSSGAPVAFTKLIGKNYTRGCVRFYVKGVHEVQAGKAYDFGSVGADKQFMASVFKNGCGGAAVKNAWFKTSGVPENWWSVR